MRGLMMKDLRSARGNIWVYLILIAGFSLASNGSGMMMAMFYTLMIPINALALDERSHFDRMTFMLPTTSLQYVLCKYMLSYGFMALSAIFSIARASYDAGAFAVSELLAPSLAICLISQAITLVLIFRFGVEKGRMMYMISIIVQAALLGALGALFEQQVIFPPAMLGAAAFVLALALNVASIFVSGWAYDMRALE